MIRRVPTPAATGVFYRLVMLLKGADGVVQVLGALVLVVLPPALLAGEANAVATRDLVGDRDGTWADHLARAVGEQVDGDVRAFAIAYLLLHGLVKLGLVAALLRRALAAYPVAIAVFGAFLAFELLRLARTGSVGLAALAAFDVVVLVAVARQFGRLLDERRTARYSPQ